MAESNQTFTFGLWGCVRKHRPVVLSMMQWVNSTSALRWQYRLFDIDETTTTQDSLDLLLIFDQPDDFSAAIALKYAKCLMFVGGKPVEAHTYIPFPDLTSRVVFEKAIADIVKRLDRLPSMGRQLACQLTPPDSTQKRATRTRFKLKNWPPNSLLRGPQHVKLAAILTGRYRSLDELAKMSGMPKDLCESFVFALEAHHVLADTQFSAELALTPKLQNSPTVRVKREFFHMLRKRLGL